MKKLILVLFLALFPFTTYAYSVVGGDSHHQQMLVQDLQGLPDVRYTFLLVPTSFACAGIDSAGCTETEGNVSRIDTDLTDAQFSYVVLYEYAHARFGPSEPQAQLFATNLSAARGNVVSAWGVTEHEQAAEDSYNQN